MNKEFAFREIEKELNSISINEDVKTHYTNLANAINNPTHEGLKILVFQPCSNGDIITSQLCAELFQIKYPGCTLDYMIDPCCKVIKETIATNPFINQVIVEGDWNQYFDRNTLVNGPLRKQYDLSFGIYWWDGPPKGMIVSFLEDLELPTNYTRVKIYTKEENDLVAKEMWANSNGFKIALQGDINCKWSGNYQELKSKLSNFGTIIEVGIIGKSFSLDSSILKYADFFIGAHGGVEHLAAAVGCQCITLSDVRPPECAHVISYQNKYREEKYKHICIRPKENAWCGSYNQCLEWHPERFVHKLPPHSFPHRFPPHMDKACNYKEFKKSCIHEIPVEGIIENVEWAIRRRKEC